MAEIAKVVVIPMRAWRESTVFQVLFFC